MHPDACAVRRDLRGRAVVPGEGLAGEDVGRSAGGGDPALRQQDDALGVLAGEHEVVQRRHHRHAVLAAQLVDDLEHGLGVPEVEGGRRLVEQQHPGVLRECPGEDGALALAAGEGA